MTLYGHPIARELEAWMKEHGQEHNDEKWRAFIADLNNLMQSKFLELTSEHTNLNAEGQKVFGMSKVAGCTRSAALKALGYESEPFSGSTKVTFFIGHQLEIFALALLRACGYVVGDGQARCTIEPMLASASDGIITMNGKQHILSIKSSAYKKSGKERSGKWTRRGFPELPFEGVRSAQPSWWAQAQAEMYATGLTKTLVLVIAKDIVAAMKDDPYLGEEGNGSLTFYAEVIDYDERFVKDHLLPVWSITWDAVQNNELPPAYQLSKADNRYVELEVASATWEPNATALGTPGAPYFNVCAYCDQFTNCAATK